MTKESDQILFSSLKDGSENAFKRAYEDNRSLFFNFATKYGVEANDAMDIYQDAYVVFYENVQSGKLAELRSSISTYLIGIGKYMILDSLRKKKQKVRSEILLSKVQEVDDTIGDFDLDKEPLNPRQALLQRKFEKLGEKCKVILTLFYFKKYSLKQIMKAGNYNSENVVKSQKSRCLKTLKDAINNSSQ